MPGQRDVAFEALRRYDVSPQRVRLAAESFNSVFRVTTASAVYALRVGAVLQIHPECTATVEAAWHRRLRQHGVDVPDVLANTCGEFATWVDNGRAGQAPQECMLFEWVAGRSLRTCLTERRAVALGSLSARLHQEAADWCPPGGAAVLRADRVLYWQLPDRLAEAGARFGFGTLFADAAARAQLVIDWLWERPPHPPHLVHGDLSPQNVLVASKRGLVLIDFQDTVVGFDVQDLSITVSALRRFPEGGQLIEAFRTGYSEVRPWPYISPALFDSLIAARALHQLNLTLNIVDMAGLGDYIASHAERARGWMHRPTGL